MILTSNTIIKTFIPVILNPSLYVILNEVKNLFLLMEAS